MKKEFDLKKVQQVISTIQLSELNPYELQALGKMIEGTAESMIYQDIVDNSLQNQLLSGDGTPSLN